ncbi:MAG TPA: hypothetical protein PLM96_07750 [Methanoregulaceae archaeon]|jgi:hypothetical protein|nr:hypothetical protein [Methanolinea sp.]MDD5049963.1 hypothetical protein [Methanoregulaceae archaeon]HOP68067.1 hypothetical protein [Methanoregulaceae archaeon]HPJ75120.1 hypothetical protein [Methanoregulaceae archaeon]HPQ76520.1 hypothetical protein [Methanoregulaceae archaeon]
MRKDESCLPIRQYYDGILVLLMGFCFHWVGLFISIVNRNLAMRIGIWEKDNLP